eukprot:g18307.t1
MAVRFPWWSSTSSTSSATSSDVDALSVQEDLTDDEQQFLQPPSHGAVEGPTAVEPTETTAEYVATVINAKTWQPAEGVIFRESCEKANCDKNPHSDAESTAVPSDEDRSDADRSDDVDGGSPTTFEQEWDDGLEYGTQPDTEDLVSVQGAESDDAAASTEDEADHEDNAGSGSPDTDAESTHAPSDMGDLVEDMEGAESDDAAASTDVPWDASDIEYEDSESEAETECLTSCDESASHDPMGELGDDE